MTNGVINLYKEAGFTSHDVVAIVRRILKTKKVGHTGTLDPDATGVLPVCVGRATKFADHFAAKDKTYVAEVILGLETSTGDTSGEVLRTAGVIFCEKSIQNAVNSFAGKEYMQVPPMYSAIKIKGQKLYELARKGETIDRPARPVFIHQIQVTSFDASNNRFTIEVTCSKGTYIRSLAMDIGNKLGLPATMGKLIRTRSGIFFIENAVTLSQLEERTQELITPIETLLPYPTLDLSGDKLKQAKNGNALTLDTSEERIWLADSQVLIGLFKKEKNKFRPEVML